MPETYEVVPYSFDELKRLLREHLQVNPHVIKNNYRITYLDSYFQRLDDEEDGKGPKTIVLEKEYTDRHYLENFSAYQVRCFETYPRKCGRLHFFDIPFKEADLEALLLGDRGSLDKKTLITPSGKYLTASWA